MKNLNSALKVALLGTVATGVMMVALPDDAKADAYALSQVEVRQLTLSGLPGFGGFFDFNAQTNADLTGQAGVTNFDDADAAFSLDQSINTADIVDPAHAFVADGGAPANPGENSFAALGSASPNYARADTHLTDTLVNIGAGSASSSASVIGGDWQGIAEAATRNKLGVGTAGASNQVWEFSGSVVDENASTPGAAFTIDFDIAGLLKSEVDANDGGSANASFSIDFKFQNTSTGLGTTTSISTGILNAAAGDAFTFDDSNLSDSDSTTTFAASGRNGGFTRVTIASRLAAGDYRFTIVANQNATAQSVVPEPGTLGLLGAGLAGIGFIGRRRRKIA